MTRRFSWLLVVVALAAGCAAPGGAPSEAGVPATQPSDPVTTDRRSPSASDSVAGVNREAVRRALLGPSPVPSAQEQFVDEIMAVLDGALADIPAVDGMPAEEAACATWRPLVGRLDWVGGVVVERQVALAHLTQLAAVAPDAIRTAAADAARITGTTAAEQLASEADMEVVNTVPHEELRSIGAWALEHCDLEVTAESDPNTDGWTDDDFEYSCELDRSLLEHGMEEYADGPGGGRYPSHPHELEVNLEGFVYPAWHRIVTVDNEARQPTFVVEPISGGHCDR